VSSVGKQYTYIAKVGRFTGRYGQTCTVIEWHRSKVLVQFPGEAEPVLTLGRCMRRVAVSGNAA
jgi:hypothetical protein